MLKHPALCKSMPLRRTTPFASQTALEAPSKAAIQLRMRPFGLTRYTTKPVQG